MLVRPQIIRVSMVILFSSLFFNIGVAESKTTAQVSVDVDLFPVGSFVAHAPLSGKGVKQGAGFAADELKVKVNLLKTGNSLRDQHLREKMESEKFPHVIVRDIKAKNGHGTATIKIMSIEKSLSFDYEDHQNGFATAIFDLNLNDYNFSGINYLGVGVEDEIKIKATVPYETK